MPRLKTNLSCLVGVALVGALAAVSLCGCGSANKPAPAAGAATAPQPATFALFGPAPQKSGVQLWSENCARCHNMRPASEFSDSQWATIVHHMRLRANLTGQEAREITKFLQASN